MLNVKTSLEPVGSARCHTFSLCWWNSLFSLFLFFRTWNLLVSWFQTASYGCDAVSQSILFAFLSFSHSLFVLVMTFKCLCFFLSFSLSPVVFPDLQVHNWFFLSAKMWIFFLSISWVLLGVTLSSRCQWNHVAVFGPSATLSGRPMESHLGRRAGPSPPPPSRLNPPGPALHCHEMVSYDISHDRWMVGALGLYADEAFLFILLSFFFLSFILSFLISFFLSFPAFSSCLLSFLLSLFLVLSFFVLCPTPPVYSCQLSFHSFSSCFVQSFRWFAGAELIFLRCQNVSLLPVNFVICNWKSFLLQITNESGRN